MADIKGHFKVNINKALGANIPYAILVSTDSLVFARVAGQISDIPIITIVLVTVLGAIGREFGGIEIVVLAGAVGGAMGGLIDSQLSKRRTSKIDKAIEQLSQSSVEQILQSDKGNFRLSVSDVESISLRESTYGLNNGSRGGVLHIIKTGEKAQQYDISAKSSFASCVALLQPIFGNKLQILN